MNAFRVVKTVEPTEQCTDLLFDDRACLSVHDNVRVEKHPHFTCLNRHRRIHAFHRLESKDKLPLGVALAIFGKLAQRVAAVRGSPDLPAISRHEHDSIGLGTHLRKPNYDSPSICRFAKQNRLAKECLRSHSQIRELRTGSQLRKGDRRPSSSLPSHG